MVNLRKERWWIYGKSSTEEFETSELIPLRPLEHKPFYIEHEGCLVLRDVEVPVDGSIIKEIGELPSDKARLKDDPEAYAVAIWMVGYFGSFRTIKPVTDKMISLTLSVDQLSVTKARKALDSKYLTIQNVVEKVEVDQKKKPLSVGFKYVAKILLKESSYKVLDSPLKIPITPSTPLTKEELKLEVVKRRSKSVDRVVRSDDVKGVHIEDKMQADGKPLFEIDVEIQMDLSSNIINELDAMKVSETQFLHHGNQKDLRRDILNFINLLQNYFEVDLTENNMMFGEWVSDSSGHYFKISQASLQKVFGNGDQLKSPKGIVKALNILENELGWIEAKRNSNNNKSYRAGEYASMYRFSSKFVEMNGGKVKNYRTTKRFRTYHEVLTLTTLDSKVFADVGGFDDVATAEDWNPEKKKRQFIKVKNFDLYKCRFSEPRIASRVYVSVAYLPKELRSFVRIDRCETSEIDLKTAHPFLIAHFFKDSKKKEAWLEYLNKNDVYLDLIDKVPIPKKVKDSMKPDKLRKCFKNLMNAYMNGGGINAFDSVLELDVNFGEYVAKIFPDLDEIVQFLINTRSEEGENNGTAIELQELESKIIGTHFMCHSKYQCISLHDGLLCKEQEVDELIKDVELRCKEVLGFDMVVEIKD